MQLVTTTAELEDTVSELGKSDFITIDTEFMRESTFWPELCLIQMATADMVTLIDPLSPDLDLSSFFQLMADETTVKVFHAARQDIEIIHHMGKLIPHPVFDTQIAAMVCGFGDSISYDGLVSRITGGHIDKSSRFTDWKRRPLSEKQLVYATADVTHLIDVYLRLVSDLERENRAHWLTEEMAILTSPDTYDVPPEDAWKRLKMRVRKPRDLAVLQEVAAWREREARERNVPRGRVIKDDAIQEVAQQHPKTPEALARMRMIPRGWERTPAAKGLLGAVESAMDMADDTLPRVPRPSRPPEGAGPAAELLKVLLRIISQEQGVAAKVLASSDDLDKLAIGREKADVPALKGWRRDVFGDKALKLIDGRLAMRFEDKKVRVFEIDTPA